MSVHHKDDCPCGSGKRYKHCHLPADEARRRKTMLAGVFVVGAIVVGAAAFGAINQWQLGKRASALAGADSGMAAGVGGAIGGDASGVPAPSPGAFGIVQPGRGGVAPLPGSTAGSVIPVGSGSNALAPGENPIPWEYDVAKNRHYDPRIGHQHWHNGPPPSDTLNAVVTAPRQIKLDEKGNMISETSARVAGSTPTVGSTPLKPGENPKPYEYDKAKNQYYDPEHGHWHSGPPPAGK